MSQGCPRLGLGGREGEVPLHAHPDQVLADHFYQKPDGWYGVGATDLSLRRCLETKVDVFRAPVGGG